MIASSAVAVLYTQLRFVAPFPTPYISSQQIFFIFLTGLNHRALM